MEKELASFIHFESQIDKIIDLVTKLKEENEQLRKDNDYLQIQNQSLESLRTEHQDMGAAARSAGLSRPQAEDIRRRVKQALLQLNQLKTIVLNGN